MRTRSESLKAVFCWNTRLTVHWRRLSLSRYRHTDSSLPSSGSGSGSESDGGQWPGPVTLTQYASSTPHSHHPDIILQLTNWAIIGCTSFVPNQIILSSRASTAPVMGSWVDSLCQMTVNATSTPLDSMTGAPSRYFEPQCQM